ncbi:MAG: tetratricopeptide repeat protein [Novosphingobium sp.]
MKNALAGLAAGMALIGGASAIAQVAGVSEAQLDKGFLGEQNVRNTNPGSPDSAHYLVRANQAVSTGEFNKALAILRLNRATATHFDALLAGQAHAGLGDYAAARKDYRLALRKQRNFISAHQALGEMEARYGDKAAAQDVLTELATRRDACGSCSSRGEFEASIGRVEAALKARP